MVSTLPISTEALPPQELAFSASLAEVSKILLYHIPQHTVQETKCLLSAFHSRQEMALQIESQKPGCLYDKETWALV